MTTDDEMAQLERYSSVTKNDLLGMMDDAIDLAIPSMAKLSLERGFAPSEQPNSHYYRRPWVIEAIRSPEMKRKPNEAKEIMGMLLAHGADPNAVELQTGLTALQIAIREERTWVIEALLKAGADPNHTDHDGWTPLMLLFTQTNSWTPERIGPNHGSLAVIGQLLIRHGAEPNLGCTEGGSTAMHLAATKGMTELCHVLAKAGGRVDVRDCSKRRPRDIALKAGHNECAEELAKWEAIVDCETDLEVMTAEAKNTGTPNRRVRL